MQTPKYIWLHLDSFHAPVVSYFKPENKRTWAMYVLAADAEKDAKDEARASAIESAWCAQNDADGVPRGTY